MGRSLPRLAIGVPPCRPPLSPLRIAVTGKAMAPLEAFARAIAAVRAGGIDAVGGARPAASMRPKAVPIAVLLPGVGSPCRIGLRWGSTYRSKGPPMLKNVSTSLIVRGVLALIVGVI